MVSYNISVDSAERWMPDNGVDVPGWGRVQITTTAASAIWSADDAGASDDIAQERRELTYASCVQT